MVEFDIPIGLRPIAGSQPMRTSGFTGNPVVMRAPARPV